MKKPTARKTAAKKTQKRAAKGSSAKLARLRRKRVSAPMDTEGKLTFNHAMIYVKDVDRGLRFYRDLLGFKLMITQFRTPLRAMASLFFAVFAFCFITAIAPFVLACRQKCSMEPQTPRFDVSMQQVARRCRGPLKCTGWIE
jgi:hypothetical protein